MPGLDGQKKAKITQKNGRRGGEQKGTLSWEVSKNRGRGGPSEKDSEEGAREIE